MLTKPNLCFYFLLYFTSFLLLAFAGTILPSLSASHNLFSGDIFQVIATERTNENVVFSPASIETAVALTYFGAEGKTAEEMRAGLKLGNSDKPAIAKHFGELLKSFQSVDNGPTLRVANRIFLDKKYQISPKFNEIASKYFASKAENLDFGNSVKAADVINHWVEQQTENKIKDLLNPNAVTVDTSMVLVNAIYFKGNWERAFSKDMTHEDNFYVSSNKIVPTKMMYQEGRFKYADLNQLDAKAIEMPYKDSDLSMMIILPNNKDGLQNLERKLAGVDLNDISATMKTETVEMMIPKFRIEFDIDLNEPLKRLGMTTMFGDEADFSSLFTTTLPQQISEVKHKAYLDVNEAGSEAAAATFVRASARTINLFGKTFVADHPFVFAIRSNKAVFFIGHLVNV